MAEPFALVADLAKAHIAARCLHVIAECGVADALGDEPASAAELAARTGLNPDALERLLRLLAAHDVFAHDANGYAHTPASRLLRSDHPGSLRAYVRMNGAPVSWNAYADLLQTAQSGSPAIGWAERVAYFAANPEEANVFNAAMVAKSRAVVPAVVAAYDFGAFDVIADIGGGRGHLLTAILERTPAAFGVLFELPHVVADAAPAASARVRLVAGDFFADPLPVADAYLLMDLLHDWSDADAARILARVRSAAPPDARLLIVETLVPDTPGPHFGKTLDVVMLAITGGRERTRTQYAALLSGAGFRLERIIPTASEYSLVEATAA